LRGGVTGLRGGFQAWIAAFQAWDQVRKLVRSPFKLAGRFSSLEDTAPGLNPHRQARRPAFKLEMPLSELPGGGTTLDADSSSLNVTIRAHVEAFQG
jgi:hypothetical protein